MELTNLILESNNDPVRQSRTMVVGHRCPLFALSEETIFVGSVSPESHRCCVKVDDQALGEVFNGYVISEYLQLFYYFLNSQNKTSFAETYYIHQYRKFLSLDGSGPTSPAMPYLRTSLPNEVADRNLSAPFIISLHSKKKELIGPVLSIGNLTTNYGKYHIAEDFVMFNLAMRDSSLFDSEELKLFIYFPYLVPSPSVGVFFTKHLLNDLRILQAVWEIFYHRYYTPRDGYQRRVGGFLLERLHSFMLLRRALKDGFKNTISSFQYIVSEDGDPRPTL